MGTLLITLLNAEVILRWKGATLKVIWNENAKCFCSCLIEKWID